MCGPTTWKYIGMKLEKYTINMDLRGWFPKSAWCGVVVLLRIALSGRFIGELFCNENNTIAGLSERE